MAEPKKAPEVGDSIEGAKTTFPDCPAGAKESCPAAAAKSPSRTARVTQCVKQIKATTDGTNGVRKVGGKAPERPPNVLRSSTSSDKRLIKGKQENFVVLVRGSKDVTLEAVTTPPNTAVKWTVEANQNSNSPPAIDPAVGVKAALKTNAEGSFSVIAVLGGCKVVWNVVFVSVKVDVQSSKPAKPTESYTDDGSSNTHTRFKSGEFAAGKYAWEDQLHVKLTGGGDDQKLGVKKVKLHVLQDCWQNTLTGHYAAPPDGSAALEKAKGGLPILDSTNEHGPFLTDSDSATVTEASDVDRDVWTGDSPGSSFPRTHQFTSKPLTSITGGYSFETAIAAVSDDAPNTIVVHSSTKWSTDYSGTVDAATGRYTRRGAKTIPGSWSLISDATGGKDAGEAGIETFEPRFNDTLLGADYDWKPSK